MTRARPPRGTLCRRLCGLGLVAVLLFAPLDGAEPRDTTGETSESLAGRLLIAREELRDPNFARTVVLMLQHDAGGAMGLVINRPLGKVSAAELLEEMGVESKAPDREITAHYGGPVEPERGFLLHSGDTKLEESQAVPGGFAVTVDPEMLRRIAEGGGPEAFRFILGYAGWAPGQLESEMAGGAWWHVEADPDLVFAPEAASIWQRAIDLRGVDL